MERIEGNLTTPKGFLASAVRANIKGIPGEREDMMVIYSPQLCTAAGVFTKNTAKSGTVLVCQKQIEQPYSRVMLGLSGIANTCTGDDYQVAEELVRLTSESLSVEESTVLLATTGKIGVPLPIERVEHGFSILPTPSIEMGEAATRAIMTTDSHPKVTAYKTEIGGREVFLSAMAKGSGMIHPNMGTTLSFLTTDATISKELLQRALSEVVEDTLNMVDVDGDTSTNDSLLVMASGAAKNVEINSEGEDFNSFKQLLYSALRDISRLIAGDGEGSGKLITSTVEGASTVQDARALAKAVISSTRFKVSMSSVNDYWGRILGNMGNSGVVFNMMTTDIYYRWNGGSIACMLQGKGQQIDRAALNEMSISKEVDVHIILSAGTASATAYGCDLTKDYVDIVAHY